MVAQGIVSVRMNRWAILAGYALLTGCTQLLWLAYAPITTQTHQVMGVSEGQSVILPESSRSCTSSWRCPLAAGWTPGSGRRSASARSSPRQAGCSGWPGPTSYGWALAGQFVTALGQPFVLNRSPRSPRAISRPGSGPRRFLSAAWPCSSGILAAVLSSGPLLHAGGFTLLLQVQAAVALLAALWVLAAVRTASRLPGRPVGRRVPALAAA